MNKQMYINEFLVQGLNKISMNCEVAFKYSISFWHLEFFMY